MVAVSHAAAVMSSDSDVLRLVSATIEALLFCIVLPLLLFLLLVVGTTVLKLGASVSSCLHLRFCHRLSSQVVRVWIH